MNFVRLCSHFNKYRRKKEGCFFLRRQSQYEILGVTHFITPMGLTKYIMLILFNETLCLIQKIEIVVTGTIIFSI